MKIIKDLKIGDILYEIHDYKILTSNVISLNGTHGIILDSCAYSKEEFYLIKEQTNFLDNYNSINYCNQSECLIALKEILRKDIDNQMKKIAKECDTLAILKEEMFKYL